MTGRVWEDMGDKGGVRTWRLRLARRIGNRTFVYVRDFGTFADAVTETGYVRRFGTVAEAKRYLEV